MNGKLSIIIIVLLALGLVASLGNMSELKKANTELLEAAEKNIAIPLQNAISEVVDEPSVDSDENDRIAKLEATIASREDRIAKLAAQLEEAQRATNTATVNVPTSEERRESRQERYADYMEKLKEEDPERYEEMQAQRKEYEERREKMRDHMKDTMARQSQFILEMDTSVMSEEQLANHNKLADLMQQNWKHMEVIQTEGAEQADVWEARRGLMTSMRDMDTLLKSERDVALASYGRELGLQQGDSDAFSNDIRNIMDMTSLQSYWSGWGRRGGSRGGQSNQEDGR